MGTPEFPNLGKHCDVEDCKLIDFLPFTCDRCHQVYCLEHRSYSQHHCPHANKDDSTVVICPLCAKGVRLIPNQDPNITWESHVNAECDPSNYEKATKKKKCPVPRCREVLVFSNTIKCRDCQVDHCLKHRFGPDHQCPGPKKPETGFQFLSLLSGSSKEEPKRPSRAQSNRTPSASSSSSTWTRFVNAASRLGTDVSQAISGQSSSRSGSYSAEVCPQCYAKFSTVEDLVEHAKKVHERSGSNRVGTRKVSIDACPKCSKGFHDPVALVEHVEREHGGTSKA